LRAGIDSGASGLVDRGKPYAASVPSTDEVVEQILRTYNTITVVGASRVQSKAAHAVPQHMQRHGWRIIPITPHAEVVFGEPAYRRLADVPEQIGLVDVFRPSAMTPDVARQAVDAGATAVWLQLGITSDETRAIATDASLLYVEDRCLMIEQRRLGLEAP
jgi:uncharacterized protein